MVPVKRMSPRRERVNCDIALPGQKPRNCTQRAASNTKSVRLDDIICLRRLIWYRSLESSRFATSCAICVSFPSTRLRSSRQTRRQFSATSASGTKDRVRIWRSRGSEENWNGCAVEDETGVEKAEELIGCERNARVKDAAVALSGVEVAA